MAFSDEVMSVLGSAKDQGIGLDSGAVLVGTGEAVRVEAGSAMGVWAVSEISDSDH